MGINTVLSIVVVFIVGIAGFVLTYPELPLAPLVSTAVLTAVLFPILFYPFPRATAVPKPPTAPWGAAMLASWTRPSASRR